MNTPCQTTLVARVPFNAGLIAALSLFLTGCFTTQPPAPAITGSAVNAAPVQTSAGATTKDRNEVVTPMKQPDKPAGSTKPQSEPVTPPKPKPAPAKSTPTILAKKAAVQVTPLSVRAREITSTPAPVASVSTPLMTEVPGALIFTGDKSAVKEHRAENVRSRSGFGAFKWFGMAILVAGLASAICPPLRARITGIAAHLATRFRAARKVSPKPAEKWGSKGKLKVKGAVTLAPATPFGNDTRRDQK